MKKFLLFCILTVVSLSNISFAQISPEKITNYKTDILINADGSLDVNQEITAIVTGNEIKHGIFLELIDKKITGNTKHPKFKITKVEVNGNPAPYSKEYTEELTRIKIGDKEKLLEPGIYTFKFSYNVLYEIAFYENHDELFFNMNSSMPFIIEKASGSITWPESFSTDKLEFNLFRGALGSNFQYNNYKILGNRFEYNLEDGLSNKEIITAGIKFPKGTFNREILTDISIKLDPIIIYAIIFGIFLVSLIVTNFIFKKNNFSVLVKNIPVNFDIPKNLAPSEARLLFNFYGDYKSISVELINLAIKGVIKIDKDESGFWSKNIVISLLDKSKIETEFEKKIIDSLFLDKNIIKTGVRSDEIYISSTIKLIKNESFGKNYLNFKPAYIRSLYMALQYLIIGIIIYRFNNVVPNIENLAVIVIVISLISLFMARAVASINSGKKSFYIYLSIIVFLYFNINQLYLLPIEYLVLVLLSSIPYWVFEFKNNYDIFSEKGLEHLIKLRGFKKFALSQEKYLKGVDLDIPLSFNMYEKYLPFAIAIDIETEWAKKFNDVFIKLSEEEKKQFNAYSVGNLIYINSVINNYYKQLGGTSDSSFAGGGYAGGGGGGGRGGGW